MDQEKAWQDILKKNIRTKKQLAPYLSFTDFPQTNFSLNLPIRLARKIHATDPLDPIIRQFIPLHDETILDPMYVSDPLCETSFRETNKLLRKYPSRALLLCTSACAMHCRFCFRKEFEYAKDFDFDPEIQRLEKDPSIEELILSGGDPLSLATPTLARLCQQLESIPHIKRLRIHSRFIVGIPERITDTLLQIFAKSPLQIYFVLHTNHPVELDLDVLNALQKLKKVGVTLLQQGVLLKDINDTYQTLKTLYQTLVNHGVIPYYLHQLDQTIGTTHFSVSIEKGKQLIAQLRDHLSGYAVPLYVKEIPHRQSKTVL